MPTSAGSGLRQQRFKLARPAEMTERRFIASTGGTVSCDLWPVNLFSAHRYRLAFRHVPLRPQFGVRAGCRAALKRLRHRSQLAESLPCSITAPSPVVRYCPGDTRGSVSQRLLMAVALPLSWKVPFCTIFGRLHGMKPRSPSSCVGDGDEVALPSSTICTVAP